MLVSLLNFLRRLVVYFTYTKTYMPNRLRNDIGQYSYGVPTVFDFTKKYKLIIGKFCSISENVVIFLDGNHRIDWVTSYPPKGFLITHGSHLQYPGGHPASKGDVIIGNDVWLAYGATILSGVKINDGAVVAAGAVVSKDVPAYAVVAGNPAKVVKYRFSPETIEKLLKIQWWNWSKEKIEKNVNKLLSPNVEQFVNEFITSNLN